MQISHFVNKGISIIEEITIQKKKLELVQDDISKNYFQKHFKPKIAKSKLELFEQIQELKKQIDKKFEENRNAIVKKVDKLWKKFESQFKIQINENNFGEKIRQWIDSYYNLQIDDCNLQDKRDLICHLQQNEKGQNKINEAQDIINDIFKFQDEQTQQLEAITSQIQIKNNIKHDKDILNLKSQYVDGLFSQYSFSQDRFRQDEKISEIKRSFVNLKNIKQDNLSDNANNKLEQSPVNLKITKPEKIDIDDDQDINFYGDQYLKKMNQDNCMETLELPQLENFKSNSLNSNRSRQKRKGHKTNRKKQKSIHSGKKPMKSQHNLFKQKQEFDKAEFYMELKRNQERIVSKQTKEMGQESKRVRAISFNQIMKRNSRQNFKKSLDFKNGIQPKQKPVITKKRSEKNPIQIRQQQKSRKKSSVNSMNLDWAILALKNNVKNINLSNQCMLKRNRRFRIIEINKIFMYCQRNYSSRFIRKQIYRQIILYFLQEVTTYKCNYIRYQ